MKHVYAATIVSLVLSSTAFGQTATLSDSMARKEARALKTCSRDTQKDCSRLPDLVGLSNEKASVKAARGACDQFNKSMSNFCMMAADHPPESREVMTAVAASIAAKKAMTKAIEAAKADKS